MPTVKELRAIAKQRNLKGYSTLKKKELEQLIYGSVCGGKQTRNLATGRCKIPKKKYAPMRPADQFGKLPKRPQYMGLPETPRSGYVPIPERDSKGLKANDQLNFQPFNRKQAEWFIGNQPAKKKAYLIRPTSDPKADYAVTYKEFNKDGSFVVVNSLVYKMPQGYTFGREGDGVFRTINDLVLGHGIA